MRSPPSRACVHAPAPCCVPAITSFCVTSLPPPLPSPSRPFLLSRRIMQHALVHDLPRDLVSSFAFWCSDDTMELRVGKKYRLGKKIGSGSFGDIYLGTNVSTGEEVHNSILSLLCFIRLKSALLVVVAHTCWGLRLGFVSWIHQVAMKLESTKSKHPQVCIALARPCPCPHPTLSTHQRALSLSLLVSTVVRFWCCFPPACV